MYKVCGDVVKLGLSSMVQVFWRLSHVPGASLSYNFLYWTSRACLQLLMSDALIPDVLPIDANCHQWKVIYKPFSTCAEVREVLSELRMTYFEDDEFFGVFLNNSKLGAESAVLHYMSAALTSIVTSLGYCSKLKSNVRDAKDVNAFFNAKLFQILASSERTTAASVCRWLSVFDLMKIDINIKIVVSHQQNSSGKSDYAMSLFLSKKGEKPTPLSQFIKQGGDRRTAGVKLLNTLHPHLEGISSLVQEEAIWINPNMFEQLMQAAGSIFTSLGVQMELPKEMQVLYKPRPVIHGSMDKQATRFQSYLNRKELMTYVYIYSKCLVLVLEYLTYLL